MREINAVPSLLVFALATGSLAQNVRSFLSSLTTCGVDERSSEHQDMSSINGTPVASICSLFKQNQASTTKDDAVLEPRRRL